jgi:hypothetical protein
MRLSAFDLLVFLPLAAANTAALVRRAVVGTTAQGNVQEVLHDDVGFPATANTSSTADVIVCRGVGDLHEQQFKELGAVWKSYAQQGIVTATSPLVYKISPEGTFSSYGADVENWSNMYLRQDGVKYLPHVFCDTTCCQTCTLPVALTSAMDRREEFFAESVRVAKENGLDGYALDFEGKMPHDKDLTSNFFSEWKQELSRHNGRLGKPLELHLWMPTAVNEKLVSPSMTSMVSMKGYYEFSWDEKLPRRHPLPKLPKRLALRPPPKRRIFEGSALLELESLAESQAEVDSQASVLSEADAAASLASWRVLRAQATLNATGPSGSGSALKSICPAANGREASTPILERLARGSASVEISTEVSAQQQITGIKRHMKSWCSRVQGNGGECGMGLITYDMGNKKLKCTDLIDVAIGSHRYGLNSLWIWSGGIIPKSWERGLRIFAKNGADSLGVEDCAKDTAALKEGQKTRLTQLGQTYVEKYTPNTKEFDELSGTQKRVVRHGIHSLSEEEIDELKPELDAQCGCDFDGGYCCDGSFRGKQ